MKKMILFSMFALSANSALAATCTTCANGLFGNLVCWGERVSIQLGAEKATVSTSQGRQSYVKSENLGSVPTYVQRHATDKNLDKLLMVDENNLVYVALREDVSTITKDSDVNEQVADGRMTAYLCK